MAEITARVSLRDEQVQVQAFLWRYYCTRIFLFVGADEQPGGGQGEKLKNANWEIICQKESEPLEWSALLKKAKQSKKSFF